jgi:hypothetical protein
MDGSGAAAGVHPSIRSRIHPAAHPLRPFRGRGPTRRGVSGGGLRLPGLAATALFCACLYGVLGTLYLRVSPGDGSARRVLRRLGGCLVLAVISSYAFMRLLPPDAWDKFFYLRYPAFPAFAALWCAALLPRESRELLRAAAAARPDDPLRPLSLLLLAAAILVTGSDLALQFHDVSIPVSGKTSSRKTRGPRRSRSCSPSSPSRSPSPCGWPPRCCS